MISIVELHGADAWRYLMESVTDGRGDLREADAVTRYYTDAGTPPGRWLGTGLAGLANGSGLAAGTQVTGSSWTCCSAKAATRSPAARSAAGSGSRRRTPSVSPPGPARSPRI